MCFPVGSSRNSKKHLQCDLFRKKYDRYWIGIQGTINWAERSPDLSPVTFLFGHIGEKLCTELIFSEEELRRRMVEQYNLILWENFGRRHSCAFTVSTELMGKASNYWFRNESSMCSSFGLYIKRVLMKEILRVMRTFSHSVFWGGFPKWCRTSVAKHYMNNCRYEAYHNFICCEQLLSSKSN